MPTIFIFTSMACQRMCVMDEDCQVINFHVDMLLKLSLGFIFVFESMSVSCRAAKKKKNSQGGNQISHNL